MLFRSRITGDRRQGCSPGAGYEKVHGAVDGATRLAYVEVLPNEQQSTTVGFLVRAVGWFSEQGMTCRRILSDNGSAYRSGAWREACRSMAIKPIRTKPYTSDQRQGRTVQQDPVERVGLCHAVPDLKRKEQLVTALSGAL